MSIWSCLTCGRDLDQADKPDTKDCGGDCLRCMAECDDPDARAAMRAIEPDNSYWVDPP